MPGARRPEVLLRAWRILDTRVVGGAQSAWGMRLLGRLLADEASLGAEIDAAGVRAAFATTYAECVLREHGAGGSADLWSMAWEGAQRLAHPCERAVVLVRVASGGLTCAAASADPTVVDMWARRLATLLEDPDVPITAPSHIAPAIAALMACLDAAERLADPMVPLPAPVWLASIAAVTAEVRHAPARAIALACGGRLAARNQEIGEARARFEEALEALAEPGDGQMVPCLQWPPRLDASSWVTVEALRGIAGLEPVEETLARFVSLRPVTSEVATNRLEALRLRLTAAVRVPEAWAPATGATPVIRPADVAHPDTVGLLAVPPRAVAIALDHVEGGRPAEGLRLLSELASMATSARNTAVATTVERARVEAVTRMRLGEHGRLSRQLLAEATAASSSDAHAIWRTRPALDAAGREALATWGRRMLTRPPADGDGEWARASVALDLIECSELGADVDLAAQGRAPISPEAWWSQHPALPEPALRLWARSAALGVSPGGPTTQLVRRIGVRRAAVIAMEEGELLALRLPNQALRLLALALTWFEDAHDTLGIWQVTTLLAMTRVRAGVPRDAVDLTALQEAHETLVSKGAERGTSGLPSWSAIGRVTHLPLPDAPGLTEWAPWMHRVIALQHWIASGVRPEVMFSAIESPPVELRDWPSDGGSTVSTGTACTPVTSSGSAMPSAPPLAMPAPARGGLARHLWAMVGAGVLLALALVIVVPGMMGLRDESVGPAPGLSSGAGQPTPGTDEPGANASSSMAPSRVPLLLLVIALVSAGVVAVWVARVTLVDDQGQPVTAAPPRIKHIEAFSGLDALRQPPLERMWLDLDPVTAWTVATVAATAGDQRQASYSWEPAVRAGQAIVTPVPTQAVRGGAALTGIQVVHVTAQAIETPQGIFFEVAGGEDLQVNESPELLVGGRGTLFDASHMAHAFPDMACAVLQPPRRPALDLTPADREACASLRVIGAALAEEGVPLVVVLPPMDGELSSLVVRLIGRRLVTLRQSGNLDPHELVVRARAMVLGHAQRLLPRDAATELASHIAVYARSGPLRQLDVRPTNVGQGPGPRAQGPE